MSQTPCSPERAQDKQGEHRCPVRFPESSKYPADPRPCSILSPPAAPLSLQHPVLPCSLPSPSSGQAAAVSLLSSSPARSQQPPEPFSSFCSLFFVSWVARIHPTSSSRRGERGRAWVLSRGGGKRTQPQCPSPAPNKSSTTRPHPLPGSFLLSHCSLRFFPLLLLASFSLLLFSRPPLPHPCSLPVRSHVGRTSLQQRGDAMLPAALSPVAPAPGHCCCCFWCCCCCF